MGLQEEHDIANFLLVLPGLADHGDALFAFAMMRLHDTSTAEDMIQETLIAAIQGLAGFKQGASVRTWLISIMKNKIVDHIRKASREQPLDERVLENDTFDDQFAADGHWKQAPRDWAEPMALLESKQVKQQLLDCISGLPEKLRTCLFMR